MAASKFQLFFIILPFGWLLMFAQCHADNPGQCALAHVKNCTETLLENLPTVLHCPQAELTCLENLGHSCPQHVSTMISAFRYLCNNDTGGLGVQAVNTCFADEAKARNLTQAVEACMGHSAWTDTLAGEARCNVATTFAACATSAAEGLCSGEPAARFYYNIRELWTSYGCVGASGMIPPGTPNECSLAGIERCTNYILTALSPIVHCPQDELTCLENLGDCDDAATLISVFRYLCTSDTGMLDVVAVNTCFAEGTKYESFTDALLLCTFQSMWVETLEGEARCNAATTYAACAKTAVGNLCSGEQLARFYNKTGQLWTSYGCFGGLNGTVMTVEPECTLAGISRCTGYLLTGLAPVTHCPHASLTCLEGLDDCDDVNTMVSVFRYLCDNNTGGMDVLAVEACFAEGTKSDDFTQAVIACATNSGWNDALHGHPRCSAATTFAACIRTAAENQCTSDRALTYYSKTEQLLKSYGCFGVEATTVMPGGKGATMIPNLGMMAVMLGLSLVMLQLK